MISECDRDPPSANGLGNPTPTEIDTMQKQPLWSPNILPQVNQYWLNFQMSTEPIVMYHQIYAFIDYMSFDLKIEHCCDKPITCRRSSD